MEPTRSTAPAAAFRRFETMIVLLRKRGVSEKAIDAFIRDKILADLSNHRENQRKPSLN